MSNVNWDGFPGLQQKLDALLNPDIDPVLLGLQEVIRSDNRRGVLLGQDGDGKPMKVTQRQQSAALSAKLGDGPPLAPKRDASRAVANLRTAFFLDGPGRWVVFGAWEDVVGKKGTPFLPFHFRGEGRLPVRDLAGLRPDGFRDAWTLVDTWIDSLLGN